MAAPVVLYILFGVIGLVISVAIFGGILPLFDLFPSGPGTPMNGGQIKEE